MLDDLRELYQEVILDHSKRPRNFRHPEDANHEAHGYNPLCGDTVNVYLKLGHNGLIEDAAFEGKGCAISLASASMMTEIIKGKTETEARDIFTGFQKLVKGEEEFIDAGDATDKLMMLAGVKEFPMRVKCATLAWHAMTSAMDNEEEVSTE
ncbi:MAG: SUF system NifU family Fe-S cluster assembly protein [Sneathiella sp.]|jgi:nitrogen fixation NifU-like protein|uniref:Fe-S cluster assembly sulfur transfer protein SufU n=1 Tax=Sneathiella sp. TaxID=1964365 RepID=UPI000C4865C5|nr:SUF system NifU family Fe-S cluster assembly protein [Sneathiella sp.]MAL80235.1 SUF system NifU family Fe-S cluster assembly protein [Sneathiella sp.]|tara:strand:- start:1097 stop:1552 length:456 start_codon:yes stop_codon:yes gene_type:complete